MADRVQNLEKSWELRKKDAKERTLKEIGIMQKENVPINFNSVHVRCGVSKNYLYSEPEIRKCIEECRQIEIHLTQTRYKKYDKTSKSKDVVIETKNRRIAKLEEENQRLRAELELLRGLLYDRK